jgi:protoheme IX farnesyltransferase
VKENSFISDFKKLVKLRLTLTVVFSASIAFLVGSRVQGDINWINWLILTLGGFLVTGCANGFNEIIEKDLDKLMTRTADRPLPSGRMNTGQALVLSIFMGLIGTIMLFQLNLLTGALSVFSIILYAIVYTPIKRMGPIAVFVGAFPGALPPLIGYFAAFDQPVISWIPLVLFTIQFVWQFPHFWAIAWVVDDDYKKAGFRLLPTTERDKFSAFMILISTIVLLPVVLLPTLMGFGGYYVAAVSLLGGILFAWYAWQLYVKMDIASAKKVMFTSFIYLPVIQLMLLFDFIR